MTDRDSKNWEEAVDREAEARIPTRPDPSDAVALEAWFTLRALEFAAEKMSEDEIERAMSRLVNADVVSANNSPARQGRTLPSWSELLAKVVAAVRPDFNTPLPSLRSGATAFESRVFETDRFAITLVPDLEGGRGSILPKHESSLPPNGMVRRSSSAGEVLDEILLDESGIFRFDVLEPGNRVDLQIGEQWIELPLQFDS